MLTPCKLMRLQMGLKLGAVAAQSGISASFLSRIENGKLNGGRITQVKIAEVLKVRPGQLFKGWVND